MARSSQEQEEGMRFHVILAAAIPVVLAGCSNMAQVGCALQAFGAGVQGRPDPACVREQEAAKAGKPAPAPNPVMQCWTDATGKNLYCQQQQ